MPTNPSNTSGFTTWNANSDIDTELMEPFPSPQKVKITKPVPKDEELPKSFEGMYKKYNEMKQERDYYKSIYDGVHKEYRQLEKHYHEVCQQMDQSIDPEYALGVFNKYVKIHKLNWKFKKGPGIIDDFIAKLEFKDVPIDDELVD